MINRDKWLAAIVVMALVGGAVAKTLAAPQGAPAPNGDILPALLTEVRGLRAAMEQMASAGPRIQLFVARLQLEETRINNSVRRLDDLRAALTKAQDEINRLADEQRGLEKLLADNPNHPERDQFTAQIEILKRDAGEKRAVMTRLTAEEAQLTQDMSADQARWTEINQRLDDLEKSLAKR